MNVSLHWICKKLNSTFCFKLAVFLYWTCKKYEPQLLCCKMAVYLTGLARKNKTQRCVLPSCLSLLDLLDNTNPNCCV
jgi:hypothetical protein